MNKIEALKLEIKELEEKVERFSSMEQAVKIVLNSGYGAIGAPQFRWYDETIAEGITTTGQIAIRYISKKINEFINKESDTIGVDYILSSDTDSVTGDTLIRVNDKTMSIEEYFNSKDDTFIKFDDFNRDYVKKVNDNDLTYSVNSNGDLNSNRIKYVMKHKVKKKMYQIRVGEKTVKVTEDHSVIVKNIITGDICSIKPDKIDKNTHVLLNIITTDNDCNVDEQENDEIIQKNE